MQAENVGELAGLVYLAMHDMIPGTTYAKSASDRMGIVIRKMEEAEYHYYADFCMKRFLFLKERLCPRR